MERSGPRHEGHLWFGPFELDPTTGELWRNAVPVKLKPQPARVLAHLARTPGQLVTREQIQEKIWGDTIVDFDQGLNSAIRQIRAALGDNAESPAYLETVPRRGYRFVARLQPPQPPNAVPAVPAAPPDSASSVPAPALSPTAASPDAAASLSAPAASLTAAPSTPAASPSAATGPSTPALSPTATNPDAAASLSTLAASPTAAASSAAANASSDPAASPLAKPGLDAAAGPSPNKASVVENALSTPSPPAAVPGDTFATNSDRAAVQGMGDGLASANSLAPPSSAVASPLSRNRDFAAAGSGTHPALQHRSAGALTLGLAAVLLVVGLGVASRLQRVERPGTGQRVRLAVLPFENLSSDPQQDYFSDGLTEELITGLTRLGPERLGVVARTSAMTYKGSDKSIGQIAEELDVGYILQGSVRKGERGLRITAQLILAQDQAHLWATSYDRPFTDILELQREVAARVVQELAPELLPGQTTALANAEARPIVPEAQDAVLRGRHALHKKTQPDAVQALQYFRQATELDPQYAQAWLGLSQALRASSGKREDGLLARQAAEKALELAPELAEAHLEVAANRLDFDWDWAEAGRELERTLELAPGSAPALHLSSMYFTSLGQHRQAIDRIERALELDPLSYGIAGDLGWTYFYARQYEIAVQKALRSLELEPNDPWATACLLHSYLQLNRHAEAIAPAQQMMRFKGASEADLARVAQGDPVAGIRFYCEWNLEWFGKQDPSLVAGAFVWLHARLGNKDQVLHWLERSYQDRSGYLIFLDVEPRLDLVRDQPRYRELLRQVNIPTQALNKI